MVRESDNNDDTILLEENLSGSMKFRASISEKVGDTPETTDDIFVYKSCPGF